EFGRVKAYGEVNEVLGMYEAFLNKWQNMSKKEREDYKQRVLSEPANSEAVKNDNEVQVYSDEALLLESSDDYTTVPTSRLAHIRGGQSKVYKAPNSEEYIPSDEFKNHVYHVTKEANFRFDKYFLLSTEKSSETGTIGWMKEQDIQSHLYVEVDSDEKEGILKGIGSGSKEPWGGKKQLAYKDLAVFEGQKIKIVKTVLIGKNIWYQGTVEKGKIFWIHANQLED
ncbi:GW dipeptide domain-containing protein, partial [Phocicoccus schoeneichii]|uniref:GW dipeptide domain-containing protein n=1 Tax=Phocicoccus schoeneichii TaxID=1812261 RepID=UPI003D11B52E